MPLLRHKARPIAIDFGSHALRVMQLAGRDDRIEVVAAAHHVYPCRAQGTPRPEGEVVEALRGILKRQRFIGRESVTALDERQLSVKNIRLPEMPDSEMASAVRFEAGERIAGLGDDAEIRFLPAGPVAGAAERQQEVIVLATPASPIRERLELLSEVGLESAGIDASLCATFRPFERFLRRTEDQDQANVFLDMGWSGTRIVITRGNQIAFTRSFDVGGSTFDELVAGRLSVDFVKAGELRRRVGEDRTDRRERHTDIDRATADSVDEAVRPAWEKLGKEIGLCLRYYAVTYRGVRPDAVTCVGGESLNARHLEFLSEATRLHCHVGFPLRNATHACPSPIFEDHGPTAEWTTAVGLAMKPASCAVEMVG